MNGRIPRVALAGFFIECNRWSPVTGADAFRKGVDLWAEGLLQALYSPGSELPAHTVGFVTEMDRLGPWEPVPLRMAGAASGGPVDHAFFEALVANIDARLKLAAPVDALFLVLHGAALTNRDDDPDGMLIARLRARLGPGIPIVALVDFQANISTRMTAPLSGLVACRTNPPVDLFERGQEAAGLLRRMLVEGPGAVLHVKLPLVPAVPSQLTTPGSACAGLVEAGQHEVGGDILNVSICSGFALADAPKCGLSVSVTARAGGEAAAATVAARLAQQAWDLRTRFVSRLTPLDVAVAAAVEAGKGHRPPMMLADVGDNPNGGGGGNTITLLRALVESGAQRTVLGVFTDPGLARRAHSAGVGASFQAQFNLATREPFAERWQHSVQVLALSDGVFLGRRGLVQGTRGEMGPSALLQVGGVQVAVATLRQQLIDPAQLEVMGVDLAGARVLVAKSRGHLGAAFDGFAAPHDILEVDCPGLTTPNLRTLPWTRLPRPVYPLDEDVAWSAIPAP